MPLLSTPLAVPLTITKTNQPSHHLFYLIENVRLTGSQKEEIETELGEKLGIKWDPIHLDAMLISPCVRDRSFWTNIPQELDTLEKEANKREYDPECCLDQSHGMVRDYYFSFFLPPHVDFLQYFDVTL